MKYRVFFLVASLVSYNYLLQAVNFCKTKNEEILELVTTFHTSHPERNIQELYAEVDNYGKGPEFIPFSALIGSENLVEKGAYLAKYGLVQDTITTFNELKLLMDIPEEIELWIENKDLDKPAHYNAVYRRIEIFPSNFFSHCPSERIFILIHELTHGVQHQKEGLLHFNNPTVEKSFEREYQADSAAAQAIYCPICFQICIDSAAYNGQDDPLKLSELGYLSLTDLQQHQSFKKMKNVCAAHAADTQANKQLRSLMPIKNRWIDWLFYNKNKEYERRLKLDFEVSRLMYGRLSSVNFKSFVK